jgi:ribosome-binding factor A
MPDTNPAVAASKETVMAAINTNNADLRRRLGMLEGKQLRIIPELEFYLDETLDKLENINRLLKQ